MEGLDVRSVRSVRIAATVGIIVIVGGVIMWLIDLTRPSPMAMLPESAYTTGATASDLAAAPDLLAIASVLAVGAGFLLVVVAGIVWTVRRRQPGPGEVVAS